MFVGVGSCGTGVTVDVGEGVRVLVVEAVGAGVVVSVGESVMVPVAVAVRAGAWSPSAKAS